MNELRHNRKLTYILKADKVMSCATVPHCRPFHCIRFQK